MPISVDVRMVPTMRGSQNFLGSMRVSFPEMWVFNRLFTVMVSKTPNGLYTAVFRDGDTLFSVDHTSAPPVSGICIDGEYGRNADRVVRAFDELIEQSVETVEEAMADESVVKNGMSFYFCFKDVDESAEEVVFLMCRRPSPVRV